MRPFRPFHAFASVHVRTRLLSLSTSALLGTLCLTACTGEDDPNKGNGSGTGNGDKGGSAGTSGLNVGGNGNKGGTGGAGGAAAFGGGTAGKGGTGGSAGKGGAAGKAGTGGGGGSVQGGEGGSGGSVGGAGGAAGFGGGNIVCASVADCPGPAATNECGGWVCEQSLCLSAFAAKDKVASLQKPGDCVTKVCDGAGALVDRVDAADVPDDNNDCTKDVCTGQIPSHENLAAGDACGNGLTCDGAGKCAGCGKASDCQAGDACKTPTCTSGVCGFAFSSASTPLPDAKPNDCKRAACDGNGHIVEIASASDLPIDATVCTQDVCVNGAPANVPTNLGQPCEGGGLCNDAGKCVACLEPSTCPGQDTECEHRTCEDNVCGTAFEAYGASVLNQTTGDCRKNVCDGTGKVIDVVDDADISNDDNVCTTDTCALGVGSHAPVESGTSCGASLLCNGAGKCVGCVTANDCAGADDACKARTCIDSVCGVAYAANGTPLADPVDGDCRGRFCDGAGNAIDAADGTDVRVDGNECSRDICYNGNPANPASPVNTPCGGGAKICSGTGACVECLGPSTCPGTDNACQTRTCVAGICKLVLLPPSTTIDAQISGDCLVNVCDGAGNVVSQPSADDVRNDNNSCTTDTCGAGGPVNTPVKPGQPCGEGGVCEPGGVCGGCSSWEDCPGIDTECGYRTCEEGLCGFSYLEDGATTESGQKPQDCKRSVCDGLGNVKSIDDAEDLPADDGLFCTAETCNAGNPQHPSKQAGTSCPRGQGGGVCDGGTTCVECVVAENCPGEDSFCSFRTCNAGVCGIGRRLANTDLPAAQQTAGDCQRLRCDGGGGVASSDDDADVPADDGNQCTSEACGEGYPYHPFRPAGTVCVINGTPQVCDNEGSCVVCVQDTDCVGGKVCSNNACVAPGPQVTSTLPNDGATSIDPRGVVAVLFNMPMEPASLVGQTASGACTGTVQLSADDFTSCVGFGAGGAATMSNGDATASFQPSTGLAVNTVYKLRVASGATNKAGDALKPFEHTIGFKTAALPVLCDGDVVISQVYAGGGNASASFKRDFVELHNRGATSVSLAGWTVQYAAAGNTNWSSAPLTGSIPAGGYYLLGLQGGTPGADLPATDADGTLNLGGGGGKVALLSDASSPGASCPPNNPKLVDFFGWGNASCSFGTNGPAAGDNAKAMLRKLNGCQDARSNAEDYTSASTAAPRNSASTAVTCDCRAINESEATDELDACRLTNPTTLFLPPGVSTGPISGSALATGVNPTAPAGHAVNLRLQLGYGPPSSNPQYAAGWTFIDAPYVSEDTNGELFSASFNAIGPSPRTWRFVYRASRDGLRWTYCDTDGAGRGAATFDPANLGTLTVSTPPS